MLAPARQSRHPPARAHVQSDPPETKRECSLLLAAGRDYNLDYIFVLST